MEQQMTHVSKVKDLPHTGKIYIFGAGRDGQIINDIYKEIPNATVQGFIDNVRTGSLSDLPIFDFPTFLSIWDRDAAIVLASVHLAEMAVQLAGAGIERYYNAFPLIETVLLEDNAAKVAEKLSPLEKLKTRVEYLYYQTQRQENLLRACMQALNLAAPRNQTLAAFEYQWSHNTVNHGPGSHYSPEFQRRASSNVCSLTGFDPSWFKGRSVLDGGCGDGRYSHALCQLGAEVLSVDMSESGVEQAKENCSDFNTHRAQVANLLTLDLGETFDLVFSFGVTHHTGDTEKAISNLIKHLKPGGYLALMVYGQPRWDHIEDFLHDVRKDRLFHKVAYLTLEEAEKVVIEECSEEERQGWFDAATPVVEDHYTVEQMVTMLRNGGLEEITNLHVGSRHLFFRGRKPGA